MKERKRGKLRGEKEAEEKDEKKSKRNASGENEREGKFRKDKT